MARNLKLTKNIISGDYIFNSTQVTKLINCVMTQGKKHLAMKITYTSLSKLSKLTNQSPIESFYQCIKNVRPILEVKSRKIGGSNYQVPVEITEKRSLSLAIKWIITASKKRQGKSMIEKLTMELYDSFNNKGNAIKKKINMHNMAEANKAFSHLKW